MPCPMIGPFQSITRIRIDASHSGHWVETLGRQARAFAIANEDGEEPSRCKRIDAGGHQRVRGDVIPKDEVQHEPVTMATPIGPTHS